MSAFNFIPVCVKTQTNESGVAEFNVKITGSDGLYFEKSELWIENYTMGDRLHDFCLKDLDGLIPLESRGSFPDYPVIAKFYNTELEETETIKNGLFLPPPNGRIMLNSFGNIPTKVPSGFYLSGKVSSLDSGKSVYCNVFFGQYLG